MEAGFYQPVIESHSTTILGAQHVLFSFSFSPPPPFEGGGWEGVERGAWYFF